ncbi:MAG: hypothetical protein QM783_01465 [Phycisphaerales bacterium]
MRDDTGAGPDSGESFDLLKSATPGVVAVFVFMFATAGGALLMLLFVGGDIHPVLGLLLAFSVGGAAAVGVLAFGESDQCVRIVFDRGSLRLTGSQSGEAVLPKGSVQIVFERASLDSRLPPSYWLYGAAFGRVRLLPGPADAAGLDSALRRRSAAPCTFPPRGRLTTGSGRGGSITPR